MAKVIDNFKVLFERLTPSQRDLLIQDLNMALAKKYFDDKISSTGSYQNIIDAIREIEKHNVNLSVDNMLTEESK